MILGIGNDIIEVDRIEAAIQRHGQRFVHRVFSEQEATYCQFHADAPRHFAGRFAAKEAVVKALGTGFQNGIGWADIQILNDGQGKPEVILSPRVKELCGASRVLVTISHCKLYAMATAIWVE